MAAARRVMPLYEIIAAPDPTVGRWHGEGRTVLAALHDLDMVRNNFPETLLLARGPVEWGPTAETLTPDNLTVAMRMCEAFDDSAAACATDPRSRAA